MHDRDESGAAHLLGPDGPLATHLEGYEARTGQQAMAEAVERVLEHDGVALVEAGTGTGKTLAYLIPAIRSGRRVVVSTATRNLQDQIVERDLPLLERVGFPVRAASLKGLGNYLCRRRTQELLHGPEAGVHARSLPVLTEWLERTVEGDQAELPLPEEHALWRAVRSGHDTRIGPRCRFHDECFVTGARQRAAEAQVVVVNHHLFFADLVLRGPHGGGILPDYDAVIFDEAHRLEDVATQFFGARVGERAVHRLAADADRALTAARRRDDAADRGLRSLLLGVDALFDALPVPAVGRRVELLEVPEEARARYHELDAVLEQLELSCVRHADASEAVAQLARRFHRVRDDLASILDAPPHRQIAWVESQDRTTVVGRSPVDIADPFREKILHRVPTLVLTSATLATDDSFAFVRQRLGIDFEVDELRLESPFDHERQAALYLPDLPDPRDPGFEERAFEELARLVELSDGGAFVLCTSVARMRAFADRGRRRFPHRVLLQGELPRSTLLSRFREVGDAVLFATHSFWEGVDVPGEALRLVVIDRLPFDVPTDPLIQARCARLEERGESPFARYLVPSAALTLKQGFGRLLRSRRDRGVVTLLDSRVRSRGYGKVFLRSLPPARRCDTFEEVEAFWGAAFPNRQKLPEATGNSTVPSGDAARGEAMEVESTPGGTSP